MHWKLAIPVGIAVIALGAVFVANQKVVHAKQAEEALIKQAQAAKSIAMAQLAPALVAEQTQSAIVDPAQAMLIERGKYLANNVALCVVCHSPKDEDGNPIPTQLFKGDVIPVRPANATFKTWANQAPALGPLAGGAGDEVVKLLETGIWPRTGKPPRKPMPPFRMKHEDAQAVVAYLKSLPG